MIKRILLAIMIAFPMSLFAQKFGTINGQQVMESIPEFQEMKTKLEASSKQYEDEFGKLQAEFEKKFTELQQQAEDTPEAIKERRMKEVQELDQKIQQFRATAQQDLQRQQAQFLQPIQEKLLKAIQTVGAEGGYTFIFDVNEPLYVGTTVEDVTLKVKTVLGVK